jgi:hypothetical protein
MYNYVGVHCPGWGLCARQRNRKNRKTAVYPDISPTRGDATPKLIFTKFGTPGILAYMINFANVGVDQLSGFCLGEVSMGISYS